MQETSGKVYIRMELGKSDREQKIVWVVSLGQRWAWVSSDWDTDLSADEITREKKKTNVGRWSKQVWISVFMKKYIF